MSQSSAEDQIRIARETGLGILQPSERDLEHGLELHEDALVIESYSLGLSAAIDGAATAKAIEAGASRRELSDLQEDMHITRVATDPEERAEYEAAWKASGVDCIVQNAGAWGNDPIRLLKRLARHTLVSDLMPDFHARVSVPDDIVKAKEVGKRGKYMMSCGMPLSAQCITVEEELDCVLTFFQLGCRMMHLTYNRTNTIGGGCAEERDGGLTGFGRDVVGEMNRVGLIVDVAHSGWQTCLDAAEVSECPIVSSHAGVWELKDHCRCKSDEVMRAIADKGGLIGITNIPAFLGGTGDITAMLDHIDYAVKHFGADHVSIGTDRPYVSSSQTLERAKLPERSRGRTDFNWFWPPEKPFWEKEWNKEDQHQSMAWTNWPLFTVGLVKRGHSDEDIRKIVGGNFLRVARDVLPG